MIEQVTPDEQGNSIYTGTFLYIDWYNASTWNLGSLEGNTIVSPNTLFINTDTSTQGRIDLITYVENYTP